MTEFTRVLEAWRENPRASMPREGFYLPRQSLLGYLNATDESKAEFGEFCENV